VRTPPELKEALRMAVQVSATTVTFLPDGSKAQVVARLGGKPDENLARFLARHADHQGPAWDVTCFRLYRSTLHPRGAVHEALSTYPLTRICREG